jgi:hypothetical protein
MGPLLGSASIVEFKLFDCGSDSFLILGGWSLDLGLRKHLHETDTSSTMSSPLGTRPSPNAKHPAPPLWGRWDGGSVDQFDRGPLKRLLILTTFFERKEVISE